MCKILNFSYNTTFSIIHIYKCCILTCIYIYIYTYTCRIHTEAIIRRAKTSLKIYTSHFIVRFELETEQRLQYIDPSALCLSRSPGQYIDPSALCLSRSPGLLNRRPTGLLCWVRVFSTESCHQRVSKLHRGSRGPFYRVVAFPTTP